MDNGETQMNTQWDVRKVWGQWQVFRLFSAHAEIAPGAYFSKALAIKRAKRLNAGAHPGGVKIIPAIPR